jgi:hypothetical protein
MTDTDTLSTVLRYAFWILLGGGLAIGLAASLLRRPPGKSGSLEDRDTLPPALLEDSDTVPIPNFPSNPRKALLGLNSPQRPYVVRQDEDGKIIMTWNLADAKWAEVLRVRGLNRDYRLEVTLEGNSHTARLIEFGQVTPDAGLSRAPVSKEAELEFGPGGGFVYRFDADIVRKDARRALKSAGWAVKE